MAATTSQTHGHLRGDSLSFAETIGVDRQHGAYTHARDQHMS
jgi:hypothetical protein